MYIIILLWIASIKIMTNLWCHTGSIGHKFPSYPHKNEIPNSPRVNQSFLFNAKNDSFTPRTLWATDRPYSQSSMKNSETYTYLPNLALLLLGLNYRFPENAKISEIPHLCYGDECWYISRWITSTFTHIFSSCDLIFINLRIIKSANLLLMLW